MIGCVIVSYNGKQEITSAIEAIDSQVENIVIVDNGSDKETLAVLDRLVCDKIELIKLKSNIGIAAALNIGVKSLIDRGCEYLLLLDQDSISSSNLVEDLVSIQEKNNNAVISVPTVCFNREDFIQNEAVNKVEVAITSGKMLSKKTFERIGLFEEKLFIDSVDFDYCLRANDLGITILESKKSYILHSLGEKKEILFFGKKLSIHLHSPIRNYFIFRNHIYLLKKYGLNHPRFIIKKTYFMVKLFLENLFFGTNKMKTISLSMKGIYDGIKNRYDKSI